MVLFSRSRNSFQLLETTDILSDLLKKQILNKQHTPPPPPKKKKKKKQKKKKMVEGGRKEIKERWKIERKKERKGIQERIVC